MLKKVLIIEENLQSHLQKKSHHFSSENIPVLGSAISLESSRFRRSTLCSMTSIYKVQCAAEYLLFGYHRTY